VRGGGGKGDTNVLICAYLDLAFCALVACDPPLAFQGFLKKWGEKKKGMSESFVFQSCFCCN
jgi:hypothetical protein